MRFCVLETEAGPLAEDGGFVKLIAHNRRLYGVALRLGPKLGESVEISGSGNEEG